MWVGSHTSLIAFTFLTTVMINMVVGRENTRVNTRNITRDNNRALLYLVRYGYVGPQQGSSLMMTGEWSDKRVREAVQDFQAFAGLNQTGELDKDTLELMETPRCGVKDIVGHGATARRKKRY